MAARTAHKASNPSTAPAPAPVDTAPATPVDTAPATPGTLATIVAAGGVNATTLASAIVAASASVTPSQRRTMASDMDVIVVVAAHRDDAAVAAAWSAFVSGATPVDPMAATYTRLATLSAALVRVVVDSPDPDAAAWTLASLVADPDAALSTLAAADADRVGRIIGQAGKSGATGGGASAHPDGLAKVADGTAITLNYKGTAHKATVRGGNIVVTKSGTTPGGKFQSPSAAGKFITGNQCAGWTTWKLSDGTGTLHDAYVTGGGTTPA